MIKKNCQVDETGGEKPYRSVETLQWTAEEAQTGKTVKLRGFDGATHLKLFRVVVSTNCTEYIVTNDLTQSDSDAAQQASGRR